MPMPALKKTVKGSYEDMLVRVPEALKAEGFGILTEIDVKKTLREKIDVDFRRYKILGACNPPLAHRALSSDIDVGVLLPCNVLVYEDDDGKTVVSAMDPALAMGEFGDEELLEIAADVKTRLERMLSKLDA